MAVPAMLATRCEEMREKQWIFPGRAISTAGTAVSRLSFQTEQTALRFDIGFFGFDIVSSFASRISDFFFAGSAA
jgi:hypothetical protein